MATLKIMATSSTHIFPILFLLSLFGLISSQLSVQATLVDPLSTSTDAPATSDNAEQVPKSTQPKDIRWPNKQLNVLVDAKSINMTERQILLALFDQIEHKSCVKVTQLPADSVNPFTDSENLPDTERNFVYIFKLQFGAYNRRPSIGLSSFGCVQQGRQSLVLTDLAFKWPELVLRYHLLRTLGVPGFERPNKQVNELLNMLPLSQKIANDEAKKATGGYAAGQIDPEPAHFAYATLAGLADSSSSAATQARAAAGVAASLTDPLQPADALADRRASSNSGNGTAQQPAAKQVVSVQYLSEEDLNKIKQLYHCKEFQNRLSLKPLNEIITLLQLPSQSAPVPLSGADSGQLANNSPSAPAEGSPSLANLYSSPPFGTKSGAGESSLRPLATSDDGLGKRQSQAPANNSYGQASDGAQLKLQQAQNSLKEVLREGDKEDRKIDDVLVDDAAKSIANHLLSETEDLKKPVTDVYDLNAAASSSISSGGDGSGDSKNSIDANQQQQQDDTASNVDSLFSESPSSQNAHDGASCKPLESCPIPGAQERTPAANNGHMNGKAFGQEKPMMLKLDEYHAQDPQLQQANQMKLSQLSNSSLASYRLMNAPDSTPQQQQLQIQPDTSFRSKQLTPSGGAKSEMLISFEQTNLQAENPIAALATSQVLKLCSCTCQTMIPTKPGGGGEGGCSTTAAPLPTLPTLPTMPFPHTYPPYPTYPTYPTYPSFPTNPPYTFVTNEPPAITTSKPPVPTVTDWPPPFTQWPEPTGTTKQPTNSTTTEPTPTYGHNETVWPLPTTMIPPTFSTESPTQQPVPITTSIVTTTTTQGPSMSNVCEQVQWVKPNKTVYASAKIVWDVDRANQNYFLCNNIVNGELVPGKTHGFSCKVSSEGKAYELHDFNVLTKPEKINLAWIQRDSDSFGKTTLPVMGGFSKSQDPYIVARCLVRDENNDVITLIGYINSQGVGWFPFDDIQIECARYDVLACVN